MSAEIGTLLLQLSLFSTLATVGLGWLLGNDETPAWVNSARRAVIATIILLGGTLVILAIALVTRDFSIEYVARFTRRDLPVFYALAMLWVGQEGSALLWAWLLAVASLFVLKKSDHRLAGFAVTGLGLTKAFLISLSLFASNPLQRLNFVPTDGQGANPSLVHPDLYWHPLTIYLGFAGLSVTFAYSMAALLDRRKDDSWITLARPWAMAGWLFLSTGMVVGAHWANGGIGWGGFWGWDAVENGTLIPWLMSVAFIHSIMAQPKRGTLKGWNHLLAMLAFATILLGAYLNRSGAVPSVHAFAGVDPGPYFLLFSSVTLVAFLLLMLSRKNAWRAEKSPAAFFSRETSLVATNWLLLVTAVITAWGTLLPFISRNLLGVELAVDVPYYERTTGPLLLFLLFLIGLCPLLGWGKLNLKNVKRLFTWPVAVAFVVVIILFSLGVREGWALASYLVIGFTLTSTIQDFWFGMKGQLRRHKRRPVKALVAAINKSRRHYGGYLVHLGIIMMGVAIITASIYKFERTETLFPGESFSQHGVTFTFTEVSESFALDGHGQNVTAVDVSRNGRVLETLRPTIDSHPRAKPTTPLVGYSNVIGEIQILLLGVGELQDATFLVKFQPLLTWLWTGYWFLLLGTAVSLWPKPQKARKSAKSRTRQRTPAARGNARKGQPVAVPVHTNTKVIE